jgi:tetratricopeptide (TPR) repeat protein
MGPSTFAEALQLAQRIGDRQAEAVALANLGQTYKNLPEQRDLDAAARRYQDSLDLHEEADRLGRARCIRQLGSVHYERLREARAAGRPEVELLAHLNAAADAYRQALELLPADAVGDLAATHTGVANASYEGGQLEVALRHWQEAIRYFEAAEDRYSAANTRRNVALALARHGPLEDGLLWAQAALRDFQTYGDRAAADIAQTKQMIADIEDLAGAQS